MAHPENDPQFAGLNVNAGVSKPPIVNPYLKPRKRQALPNAADLVEGILKGDVTRLAKAVTLVESVAPAHQAIAHEVIEKCLPHSGNSRRIGITGVPGAGKSTSIDVFGLHVLKNGGKLAVLAMTRRRSGRRVASSATRPVWRSCRCILQLLSGLPHLPGRWEVWRVKPARL